MNVLITGGGGQLGTELATCLRTGHSELGPLPTVFQGAMVTAVDVDKLDITDLAKTRAFVTQTAPNVIFNCAAMTNVDACETDPETAFRVNALGPRNLAQSAADCGAKLVHVSTDYVFSGDTSAPRCEWDETVPHTVYGKSKLLGEQYVTAACSQSYIVRTAWLYGYTGNNFVKTILRNAREKGALSVVEDQLGNPTHANDLAHHLLLLAATEQFGLYHATNEGSCSWYEFACEIVKLGGVPCTMTPCTTAEFPRPAPRPAYSSLENLGLRCTVGNHMRPWKEALESFFVHWDSEKGGKDR